MVDTVSTTAGSPTCNCSNPNSCIHSVKVTPKGSAKSYEYKQSGSLPDIYVHDKDGKGVNVDINLISKGCVTGSSGCPSGLLFCEDNEEYFGELSNGFNSEKITYVDSFEQSVKNYNIVDLVSVIALGDLDSIPRSDYDLMLGECAGAAIPKKTFTTKNGKQASVEVGPLMATESTIHVLPKYEFELGVSVAYGQSVDDISKEDRRKTMRKSNLESGHNPKHARTAHRGWKKKVPGMSVKNSLSMSGSAKFSIGGDTKEFSADLVKKEFIQYKNELKMLANAEKAMSTVSDMFSQSSSGKVKLLKIEFMYPKLSFKGDGKLQLSSATQVPYLERTITVELAPLVGVKVTFDLIQAFATAYGVDRIVGYLREQALTMEEDVKSGGNGAYVGAKLELVASGQLNLGYQVKSNEQKEYEFVLGSAVKGVLAIGVETNIRGGVRYWMVEGYFEAGATAKAEGVFELDSPKDGQLDLVFYHNGVIAKVYVEAGFGMARKDAKNAGSNEGIFSRDTNGNVTGENTTASGPNNARMKDNGAEKEWEICKKLPKSSSKYRIRLRG
ncbi:hypothetical protein L4D15_22885 [Enterovibrio norvegicus]|uniref:hypothetical protein n=1 Tax=Enterovibrio norvegicus TaxID=188144 RepID=UPI003D0C226E